MKSLIFFISFNLTSINVLIHAQGLIDLEKQFEKGYLEPIRTIVESIGWKTEKQVTLEEFF